MAANPLPYFPFYVDDYLTDPAVLAMGADSEGCYIRLLARSWKSETPGVIDEALVPEMCALYRVPEVVRPTVLGQLAAAFDRDIEGRWVQRRMVAEHRLAMAASARSRRAAETRWDRVRNHKRNRKIDAPALRPHCDGNARGEGRGEKGDQELLLPSTPPASSTANGRPDASVPATGYPGLQTNTGAYWFPSEHQVEVWVAAYPGVDIPATFQEMRAWLVANPSRRKTLNGMPRFVNSWLSREQNKP